MENEKIADFYHALEYLVDLGKIILKLTKNDKTQWYKSLDMYNQAMISVVTKEIMKNIEGNELLKNFKHCFVSFYKNNASIFGEKIELKKGFDSFLKTKEDVKKECVPCLNKNTCIRIIDLLSAKNWVE